MIIFFYWSQKENYQVIFNEEIYKKNRNRVRNMRIGNEKNQENRKIVNGEYENKKNENRKWKKSG